LFVGAVGAQSCLRRLARVGAFGLSITETVLIFVVIPGAVVLLIAGIAFAGGARRSSKRYRPGRPFEFTPVWFLSAPEQLSPTTGSAELVVGPHREALTGANEPPTVERPEPERAMQGATGGASDRW
jgi:hypothetical protein